MPRFKQPVPLQKLAFDFLVDHVVQFCDEHSVEGYLGRFRQAIADVKQHVHEFIPGVLFAELCRKFLDEFWLVGSERRKARKPSHYKAALEIMMDMKIVGLSFGGDIVHNLYPIDAKRIQGLKILDLTAMTYCEYYRSSIRDFRLQDLTVLICPKMCHNYELELIGSSCSKLQVLRIEESNEVTDEGLRALCWCFDLRIINISCCSASDDGINELLNALKKLEEFNLGRCRTVYETNCFNILSRENSLVCPSMKRFALKCDSVTDAHLRAVNTLFPNLTRLEFYRPHKGDLCTLKDLKHLVELGFSDCYFFKLDNLKELLNSIGRNISSLGVNSVAVTQNDINFIFKACGNLEYLEFAYKPRQDVDTLVIPPFEKLKTLTCIALGDETPFREAERRFYIGLEFGVMLALESLAIDGFFETHNIIELMMFDHVKFPNLRKVQAFSRFSKYLALINQLAKDHNLDFSVRHREDD